MKELIESDKGSEEIVNELTEQVTDIGGVKVDAGYWKKNFGLGPLEQAVSEYDIDMRKVKEAADAVHKEGLRIVGGSPKQELRTQGSTFVVTVDGNEKQFSFNERPKFNAHVVYYAAENGDPTRDLTE